MSPHYLTSYEREEKYTVDRSIIETLGETAIVVGMEVSKEIDGGELRTSIFEAINNQRSALEGVRRVVL